jgi:hypothetical protein
VAIERRECCQCQQCCGRGGNRQRILTSPDRHADRRVHPDGSGCRQPSYARTRPENGARAEKADPRHNLRGDPGGVAFRTITHQLDRHHREERRAEGDENVRAKSRRFLLEFPLEPQRPAEEGRQKQTSELLVEIDSRGEAPMCGTCFARVRQGAGERPVEVFRCCGRFS